MADILDLDAVEARMSEDSIVDQDLLVLVPEVRRLRAMEARVRVLATARADMEFEFDEVWNLAMAAVLDALDGQETGISTNG